MSSGRLEKEKDVFGTFRDGRRMSSERLEKGEGCLRNV